MFTKTFGFVNRIMSGPGTDGYAFSMYQQVYLPVKSCYNQLTVMRITDLQKRFNDMLSVAKIQEYMQEAIELFGQVMPLPTPDISYAVATKSKLNRVVEEQTKLVGATCSEDCCEREWAGITFPGNNGIAIVVRQSYATGKTKLKYILWHEMGHAYAFTYESAEKFWDMGLPREDTFAYRFWQEVVAN